jgi:hypothetical protein
VFGASAAKDSVPRLFDGRARVVGDLRVVPAIVVLRIGASAELGDVLRDHPEEALVVEEAFRHELIEAIGTVRATTPCRRRRRTRPCSWRAHVE